MTMITAIPMQQVKAQVHKYIENLPNSDAVPDPVGVGQPVLVKFGILQQAGVIEQGWTGIMVTIVKPDNTTQTLGPFITDSTRSSFTTLHLTKLTHTSKLHFPD